MPDPVNVYPSRYFTLQLAYAKKLASVLSKPLDETLLEYTALYKILGIPGGFDSAEPVWREALRLTSAADAADRLHQLYLSRLDAIPKFTDEPHWGCFAYEYRPVAFGTHTHAIRLHFANEDASGLGALSRDRLPVRLAEVQAMFAHIAEHEPHATTVCGGSWLYNREAYRRLFPPAFTAAPAVDEPHYQYRALWGQFLRHDWTVYEELAARFLERVAGMRAADEMADCFPYQVLLTACPVTEFFAFYDVTPTASPDSPR